MRLLGQFIFFYDKVLKAQKSIKKNTRHNQYTKTLWVFFQDKISSVLNTSKQDLISNVTLKSV